MIELVSTGLRDALRAGYSRADVGRDVLGGAVVAVIALPWNLPGADGAAVPWSVDLVRILAMAGFTIAMLGVIESLLSCVIADGMSGTRHDPDGELVAQGLGNLAAPFFGGIAATVALARTAANIVAGARRQPMRVLVQAGWSRRKDHLVVRRELRRAVEEACARVAPAQR